MPRGKNEKTTMHKYIVISGGKVVFGCATMAEAVGYALKNGGFAALSLR